MKHIHELKDLLCRELDKIAERGTIDTGSLETVHKLTDTIKNIEKIEMLKDGEYSSRGYSRGGEWDAHGHSYDGGSSYGRHYVRGHYSRDGMDMNSNYSGMMYSRDGAKDHMMNKLGEMMSGANEREREILKQAMEKIERV